MTNGFYNSNELTKPKKKAFIKDAIGLSYITKCESKYSQGAPFRARGIDSRLSLNYCINFLIKNKTSTLDCVDRFAYGAGAISKELSEYEIVFHTLKGPNQGWLLVYIIVNEESFNILIKKYNLQLKNW